MEPTTRAYTLRLAGNDNGEWKRQLWSTHLTANHAVKVWGEWLLTLRGGLPASIVDDPNLLPVTDKEIAASVAAAKKADSGAEVDASILRNDLELARRDRFRVVLAISWLSVEAGQPGEVPDHLMVACGSDSVQERAAATLLRFREILTRKGIPAAEQESWVETCTPTLSARIRDDPCWVDRSSAFNRLSEEFNGQVSVEWATRTFFDLIGGAADYFAGIDLEATATGDGKDFVIKAGNWLSANWGSGKKSDSEAIAEKLNRLAALAGLGTGESGLEAIGKLLLRIGVEVGDVKSAAQQMKTLKQAVGWKGRPSKGAMALQKLADTATVDLTVWEAVRAKLVEEAGEQSSKGAAGGERPDWMNSLQTYLEQQFEFPYRTTKDLIWEHAVLLDHALRRLSVAHSWIKRADAERQKFATDAIQLQRINSGTVAWLNEYCDRRSIDSGADGTYQIRKSAIDGWELVVMPCGSPVG